MNLDFDALERNHRRVDLGVKITELDESVNVRRLTEKKKIR